MSNSENNQKSFNSWKPNKLSAVLIVVIVLLVAVLVAMLLMMPGKEPEVIETAPPATTEAPVVTDAPTDAPTEAPTETVPPETEPVMLENMAELYEENQDVVGWLIVGDTKIDYPVMHTPEDAEKYLHLSFDQKFSYGGLPFVDARCTLDPESVNILVHGHNMNDGSQFNNLLKYLDENFYKQHRTIKFSTLYEERTYEIVACFKDRVYKKTEDVFKYYNFLDPQTEEEFNEGIAYFKEKSIYDTGVTAEYGDKLLTLATCCYHVHNGRFVVVAKDITDELANAPVETIPAN